jgi:hypothetical protein
MKISKNTWEVSDAMQLALDELKISPQEFYLTYIEEQLFDKMEETYIEMNKEMFALKNAIVDFTKK